MNRYRLALLAAFMILAVSPASAQTCWNDAGPIAEATGRLSIGQFKDAADRPETAFILTLTSPACLSSKEPDNRVAATTTLHIYATDPAVLARIRSRIGQRITVRGQPFAAHTSHHHAPIVMDVKALD